MYTQQDLLDLDRQWRKRLLLLLLLLGVLAVPLAFSLLRRVRWLSVLITIVMGSAAIFIGGVALSPLSAYRKHVRGLLSGRRRETEGLFKGFGEDITLRDRVRFRPFLVNVGDPAEGKDDRLLYWDHNLPLPDWQPGERLWIASFDKAVAAWERR